MSIELCSNKCTSTSDQFCPYTCGGTILDDKTILSAANCFDGVIIGDYYDNSTVFIEAGIMIDECPIGQNISVQEIIIHPNWDLDTYRNDIAILKLETALQFNSNVQPACLPDISFNPDKGFVSGWGSTDPYDPESTSYILKFLSVNVFSNEKCNEAWVANAIENNIECQDLDGEIIDCSNATFIYPSMICAAAENIGNIFRLVKIIAICNPCLEAIYV